MFALSRKLSKRISRGVSQAKETSKKGWYIEFYEY